jgi:hypothetical protein
MIYPNLTISSINARCNEDLQQFKNDYTQIDNQTFINKYQLVEPKNIDEMKDNINNILKLMEESGLTKDKSYVDIIKGLILDYQCALWVYRTYLFYQLLIFVSIILTNVDLYNSIYTDTQLIHVPYNTKFTSELLLKFDMAIFGSLTPTSDIDVGVQYTGLYGNEPDKLQTPLLSYIVSTLENLFLIFTQHSSLDYDIETYADMLTIKNPIRDSPKDSRLFYLDSSHFNITEFNKMLEIAGNSIARNALLADKNFDLSFQQLLDIVSDRYPDVFETGTLFGDLISSAEIIKLLQNDEWFEKSKKYIQRFLNLNYDEQRYAYYEKVNLAEQSRIDILNNVDSIDKLNISPKESCDLMWLNGDALTYRMESYTCTPTVVHVVRILQAASKDNPGKNKYITYIPDHYCSTENTIQKLEEPFCSIGQYGFTLSMLEQIGYIYRFIKTYCMEDDKENNDSQYDINICSKKINKYIPRYRNGLLFFKEFQKLQTISTAGSKKNSKRKNSKRKNSKRKNSKRKNSKRKNSKRKNSKRKY